MGNDILVNILIAFSTFSATLTLALLVKNLGDSFGGRRRRRLEEEKIEETEEESEAILKQALKQAKRTISKSEIEGIELLSKLDAEKNKFEDDYYKQVGLLLSEMKESLSTKSGQAEREYHEFLQKLEGDVEAELKRRQEAFNRKADEMLSLKQESLNAFMTNLSSRVENIPNLLEEIKAKLNSKTEQMEEMLSQMK